MSPAAPIAAPFPNPGMDQSNDARANFPEPDEQEPKQDANLEALKGPIRKLVDDEVKLAIDPEKLYSYSQIRRMELYWRGNQYLDEIYSDSGRLVDYQPIGGTWHEFQDDDDGQGQYSRVINDFRGYGRKLIAVLSQQPPNVKAVADDEDNPQQVKRAKKAQKVADLLHSVWDVKRLNRKLFLTYYKNGTAFPHTTFVSDSDKYGYVEEPVMQNVPTPIGQPTANCAGCGFGTTVEDIDNPPQACQGCQRPLGPEDIQQPLMANLPTQVGVRRYANGCVEHEVQSGLRVTTQYDIEVLTDAPWLMFEREVHKGKVFAAFPELRSKLKNEGGEAYGGGGTSTTTGQYTRDLATSPSGVYIAPRKNRLLLTETWLRPTMYELCEGNVTIDGQSQDLRKALTKLYPTGLKVTQVQDLVVKLEESRMDDEWGISPPEPNENAYPDAIGKDYLDTQDFTNDTANIQMQTWERAIPQVLIDTRRIDTTYQAKYRQLPGTFIPINSGVNGNVNDAIGHVPVATPEPAMEQYAEGQRVHGAEIIGVTPQIYGGGAAEQTAYATNLKRNQAMLQLSTYADAGRQYWCDSTFNAVMLMAKYSEGRIPKPRQAQAQAMGGTPDFDQIEDIQDLLNGGWHFEGMDAQAMSAPEQREQLNEFMKNNQGNPILLDKFGFSRPSNIPLLQDKMIGIPGWEVQNSIALEKIGRCIRELLQGQPTQQQSQQLPLPGQPPQMIDIPSIPVDEWDDHAFFADTLAEWLNTERAEEQRESNPNGFKNVTAFWRSHKGLAMGPPPPPPGVGPPGPGGPPGPPSPANGRPPLPKLPPPNAATPTQ